MVLSNRVEENREQPGGKPGNHPQVAARAIIRYISLIAAANDDNANYAGRKLGYGFQRK